MDIHTLAALNIEDKIHHNINKLEFRINIENNIGINLCMVVNHHIIFHLISFIIHPNHQWHGGIAIFSENNNKIHCCFKMFIIHIISKIIEINENIIYILKIDEKFISSDIIKININQEEISNMVHIDNQFLTLVLKIMIIK